MGFHYCDESIVVMKCWNVKWAAAYRPELASYRNVSIFTQARLFW